MLLLVLQDRTHGSVPANPALHPLLSTPGWFIRHLLLRRLALHYYPRTGRAYSTNLGFTLQSALCLHGFHFCKFNQLQIENIFF